MIRKTPKSIAGLALSVVVGANYSLPVFAQQAPAQSPVQSPFPPSNQVPVNPTPTISNPGTLADEAYTLGAGDIVRVDIFDITPELALEQRYTILTDGTVNLPWVGSVPVAGLSLRQAADVLSQRFSRFIRNPVVTVSLLAPRPLKVGVIGEVNRPGSYIISVISNEVTQTSLNQRTASEGGNQWPRVSQAIQTAGGITGLANLREVKIRRPRISGGEEVIAIDLWRFLREGDLNQDILLRDGDTIIISKATIQDSEEATQIATSNFSPAAISVSVVGEVGTPGTLQVKPTTTLNQAIMAAGGFRGGRASRKNVDLIRLNPNGTVTRRRMSIDLDQNMNEERNPRLFNNDIVVVNRTFIAGVNDFLINAIGVPLTIFSGISGFRGLIRPNN
ncbi:MAG: polysaccharide biosynthesis/export family protein [Oscillatoriales cyanobacterium C42_A2020_001]|nr:polysaccharide biosynthesis/export family protein [Leptolyngbyaceae cyanobacterium C42_A2020_001]